VTKNAEGSLLKVDGSEGFPVMLPKMIVRVSYIANVIAIRNWAQWFDPERK
jgi:hypothetical protein